MSTAKKTHTDLWEQVKQEVIDSDKGGAPGQWSARKAQMAVQEYKKRGGGFEDNGPAQKDTHLHEWTEEDWGTKSGGESGETGERYLPREVRMLLTEDEYARSTAKKEAGDRQFVGQPDDVAEKAHRIRRNGPTTADLQNRAADLGIPGRSSMDKDALRAAIDEATDTNGRGKGSVASLRDRTKDDLMQMARARDLAGRASMSKEDLVAALAESR